MYPRYFRPLILTTPWAMESIYRYRLTPAQGSSQDATKLISCVKIVDKNKGVQNYLIK